MTTTNERRVLQELLFAAIQAQAALEAGGYRTTAQQLNSAVEQFKITFPDIY